MSFKNNSPEREKTHWVRGFRGTSLGWELTFPIFLGVFIGYMIDKNTSGNFHLTIILAVIGIIVGYINLARYIELDILRMKAAKLRENKDMNQ